MKKVCIFNFPRMEDFHGYSIESLDPAPYFGGDAHAAFLRMSEAKLIDEMYRGRDAQYMAYLRDFVEKFRDADLLIFSTYNPVHPDVLAKELTRPIKVLSFNDDPYSTYIRGIPYLWAFDAAVYISPSYSDHLLLKDALAEWGCQHSYWWPLVFPAASTSDGPSLWPYTQPRELAAKNGNSFFTKRDVDLVYVGGPYATKVDRLAEYKKYFGHRLRIHGHWPYYGLSGALRAVRGKPAFWGRVTSLSGPERSALYVRTRIGLNMHLSEQRSETGNMRMYEVPAHGMMLLCDKAGLNAHEMIFEPGKEAIFYDSVSDAIEKAEYYLKHEEERVRIARAGFERVQRDYDGERNLKKFLDWAMTVPKRRYSSQG